MYNSKHSVELILNNIGEGVYVLDTNGNVVLINPAGAKILGWEVNELLGKPMHAISHHTKKDGSHFPKEECPIYAAFKDGTVHFEYDDRFFRKDGTSFPIEFVSTPIIENGKILGAIVSFKDITSRKKSEEKIRHQSELLDIAQDAIITGNLEHIVTYWNKGAERLYGWTKDEAVGKEIEQLLFKTHSQALDEARKSLKEKGSWYGELPQITKEGKELIVESRWSLIRDEQGDPKGKLVVNTDITERKKVEEARNHSDKRMRLATKAAELGIWELNLKTNKVLWDDILFNMYGLPPSADNVMNYSDYRDAVLPEDLPIQDELIQQAIEGKASYKSREFRIYRKSDGALRVLEAYDILIHNQNGEAEWIIGTNHDITERKRAEEELRKHREHLEDLVKSRTAQLEVANKELEAFSYSVSHDLRAPLRSIDGFSQALLKDYNEQLDEQGKDFLRRVRAASQRMAALIDDMLKLSRITRTEMRRERINLSTIASEIANGLRMTEPGRNVEFMIVDGLVDHGDPQLLHVGIENLLGNAWKYTGKNPAARIEFGVTNHENKKAYYVRDNGVGFDMAYADKLFGAFQRLHSMAEFEGTGIGLATVQRIIHRHGGRVWAEGKINEGATFYFTL